MNHYLHENPSLDLSVVVPIYNERDNIAPLVTDIVRAVDPLGKTYEIILVNDGSRDGSTAVLDDVAARDQRVRVLHFKGNRGQTIAIAAGMYHARGRAIVLMDGDRQNDPADIGRLLEKLAEGYECVSGWRKDRQDAGPRRFMSQVANRIVQKVTRVPVNDLGCTLKAYTRDALDPTQLFGEMHRFLAVYVLDRGGRIAELVVKHHPRTAGTSKYGMSRTARVMADILLIRILHKYRTRPSHMFAKLSQYLFLAGCVFGLWWLILAARHGLLFAGGVQYLSALILGVSAVMVMAVGLVCELVVRTRYQLAGQHPWEIARGVNMDTTGGADEAGEPGADRG
ncbi:MAG TPA: glycosyltransferase family 2 protein [Phycisphaerae bacterium]|nr:glycosyltransferase family 2 protein [Phycisphaerales bacterium]HRX87560.1 glycosyltransferase family 2 protein [Phycisphaerae bacterium]